MPEITPQKYIGIGKIWDLTNNIILSTQGGFSFSPSYETKEIPRGDTFDHDTIQIGQSYKGHFDFHDLTPDIAAVIIGGTVGTGHVLKDIDGESQVVPVTPFQITLAKQPVKPCNVTLAPIEVIGADGKTYKQVATSPQAGEFMDAGTKKLTFASAVGQVYVSYTWEDTAAGVTVKAAPGVVPVAGAYKYSGRLYSTRLRAFSGSLVVTVANAIRTGDSPMGAAVGDIAKFGFDWVATVTVPDDLAFHFPFA